MVKKRVVGKASGQKKHLGCGKNCLIVIGVIVILLILYFVFYGIGNPGITRIISEDSVIPGQEFIVTLDIVVDKNPQAYYLFEEQVPDEFIIISPDTAISNRFRVAEIQNVKSNKFVYKLRAPETPGTYTFSGEFGMKDLGVGPIVGDSQIVVK